MRRIVQYLTPMKIRNLENAVIPIGQGGDGDA